MSIAAAFAFADLSLLRLLARWPANLTALATVQPPTIFSGSLRMLAYRITLIT